MQILFLQLLTPLSKFLKQESERIDSQSGSRTFSYEDFVKNLIYGMSIKTESFRKLVLDLSSNDNIEKIGLKPVAFSTFKDGFSRFNYLYINKLYTYLLSQIEFQQIPDLKNLGLFKLVDGSLFPTLCSVDWASYKKHKKAIRLHLSFCLNTQSPSEFLIAKGNSCERSFLKSIVEFAHTYIADRGYFSFDLANFIDKSRAFFIFRLKENFIFENVLSLDITSGQALMPLCFNQVRDEIVFFTNDPFKKIYRIVRFTVLTSHFTICTNRFDLDTLQIIMLYAYRWQIELFFKFIKRTLNGIHLFSTSENGAQIHFLIILITALLQLKLKQDCIKIMNEQKEIERIEQKKEALTTKNNMQQYCGANPSKWIESIAEIFQSGFKISSDWLLYFKNFIAQVVDYQIIIKLAVT
jgi:Transposase DDE domain